MGEDAIHSKDAKKITTKPIRQSIFRMKTPTQEKIFRNIHENCVFVYITFSQCKVTGERPTQGP